MRFSTKKIIPYTLLLFKRFKKIKIFGLFSLNRLLFLKFMVYYFSIDENFGSIAQLGEHLPYKQGVTGSSPVVPTSCLKGPVRYGRDFFCTFF